MRFLTESHIHILFALLIKKPLRNGYTSNQPIHFSMTPKMQIFLKIFFRNLKS